MAATHRRERKVVSVVFCDLVGFTQRAEKLDPEDVDAFLEPYHARLRSELEHYGGTVEKFIGDAVMALFGAPVAHEDDPERAVRAALAIRDWALENEGVEVRIGIATGEALIRLDARPEAGEGMASGDVVNTAARLQSAAPTNGVLVDEATYRATRGAVELDDSEAVEAKGKTEPVPVWQARAARARFGVDVAHDARTELVGRERELGVLQDAFDRARHEGIPQLVTLVGVPGIGKSRLVYELSRIADADPDIITWRQGRCLAYGEGVTLWALGEIVKAQAGIVEQDTTDEVAAKFRQSVADVLDGSGDETWVTSHLLRLVGLGDESELGGDRRGEAFSAWRRYLEALAEQRPLVLVFEDLHWADETLLDFVDELVDWLNDVPLLVVGTARPELLERRSGWGGGKLNATTLALAPLKDEETTLLLGRLLEKPLLAADAQQALLERAGGNPLYAEQFADLFRERGSTEELPLPETLQGIIAARLDGLPEDEKELLRNAAVVGKVFWQSALGAAGNGAGAALHTLERKGFVRRQRRSSLEGESEFAFAHALVRDVAYGQIARTDRAAQHRRVAEWIEALARPEDHAEMVAYHYTSALELAQAAGTETEDLAEHARHALRTAGDRSFGLNAFPESAARYGEALALWSAETPDYTDLLFRHARALYLAGAPERESQLAHARDVLLERGEVEPAAEAEAFLALALWHSGQRDLAHEHIARAHDLVSGSDASTAKARVLAFLARFRMIAGDYDESIRVAGEALALAESLGLDEVRIHALATLGTSRSYEDRSTGKDELEQALELALALKSPLAGTVVNNLAVVVMFGGDVRAALQLWKEGVTLAERSGDADGARFVRAQIGRMQFFLGDWDEAMTALDAFIAECETSPHYLEGALRQDRAYITLARGDREAALDDIARALTQAREIKDPQRMLPALADATRVHALAGQDAEAKSLLPETFEFARANPSVADYLLVLGSVARKLGAREELLGVVSLALEGPWKQTATAAARGNLVEAADLVERIGALAVGAEMRLAAAEELSEQGRSSDSRAALERALAFYRSVGATLFIRRGEALLAATAQRESA